MPLHALGRGARRASSLLSTICEAASSGCEAARAQQSSYNLATASSCALDCSTSGRSWLEATNNRGAADMRGTSEQASQARSARISGMQLQQRRAFLGSIGLQEASKAYNERRLLGYSQEQMYAVVADVSQYQHFVPWCQRSTVLGSPPPLPAAGSMHPSAAGSIGHQPQTHVPGCTPAVTQVMDAELEVGFQVFVERYTSRVTLRPPRSVHSYVADSRLFEHLNSTWSLEPGPVPGTCWLSFHVDFAFTSPLYRHVANLFFEQVVQRMMGAFVGRCQQLYGPPTLVPADLAAGRGGRRHARSRGMAAPATPAAPSSAAQPELASANAAVGSGPQLAPDGGGTVVPGMPDTASLPPTSGLPAAQALNPAQARRSVGPPELLHAVRHPPVQHPTGGTAARCGAHEALVHMPSGNRCGFTGMLDSLEDAGGDAHPPLTGR